MRFAAITCALFLACTLRADAQQLLQVTWPTKLASPPVELQKPASDFLPAFRIGLRTLPERQVVALALTAPAFLGVDNDEAKELLPLVDARYKLIQADPVFSKAPSALPYCYSAQTPDHGQALVYVPKGADAKTPVMLFIHGYSGSFLWYQQLLTEIFPGRIIICPAYGIVTKDIPAGYLAECLDATAKKLGHPLAKPDLAGLSNGGLGACRVYVQHPEKFARLLVIAAFAPEDTLPKFHKGMNAFFIAGGDEPYVTSGYFQKSIDTLRARGASATGSIIANGDHFFLLVHQDETVKLLRAWGSAR